MTNWIIPCNPKNYDVIGAFQKLKQIDWKQSMKNIDTGDIVYIYVSRPYQKIMFQCVVVKTNLPRVEIDDDIFVEDGTPFVGYGNHMRLQLIKKLDGPVLGLDMLKRNGLKGNVQGPMRVSGELLRYIENEIDKDDQ